MPSREKDQADFDLETFVDLFDTAMSSDNPAVQRALKNLLMIAAIVGAEDAEAGMRQGPLRRVLDDQKNILRRLDRIESDKAYPQERQFNPSAPLGPVPLGPYPLTPMTVPNTHPGYGAIPPVVATWTTTNTNASTTAHEDQFKSYNTLFEKLDSKQ